jgi:hypothetical protein
LSLFVSENIGNIDTQVSSLIKWFLTVKSSKLARAIGKIRIVVHE